MHRRHLIALAFATAAAPSSALADDAVLPLAKAFPLLSAYLALPPGERSRFYLAFRAYRDKRPVTDPRAAIVGVNGARAAVAFDRTGQVLRLPTLADLKGPAQFAVQGAPFKLGPELRCSLPPSTRVDPAAIELALVQVNAAIAKVAGALSLVVPKLTAAYFPDSGTGQALLGDGRALPLPIFAAPIVGPTPYFEPARTVGAKSLVLARAPSRILLGGHPKSA
jgi:hypothetical protein